MRLHTDHGDWDHDEEEICERYGCQPVEEKVPAPEFEISISYVAGTPHLNTGIFQPGWKYVLNWRDKNGQARVAFEQGFATREEAKLAAESRAGQLAKALRPTETYRFTPNV